MPVSFTAAPQRPTSQTSNGARLRVLPSRTVSHPPSPVRPVIDDPGDLPEGFHYLDRSSHRVRGTSPHRAGHILVTGNDSASNLAFHHATQSSQRSSLGVCLRMGLCCVLGSSCGLSDRLWIAPCAQGDTVSRSGCLSFTKTTARALCFWIGDDQCLSSTIA